MKMLLREKYGDPYRISNVYLKKINEWPTIWTLDKFSVFLTQRRGAIRKLTFLGLGTPNTVNSICSVVSNARVRSHPG